MPSPLVVLVRTRMKFPSRSESVSAQPLIDQGGMIRMNWGGTVVYGQHANTGGSWINSLQTGQTVTIDG